MTSIVPSLGYSRVKRGLSVEAAPALSLLALVCAIAFAILGVLVIIGYLRHGPGKNRLGVPVRMLLLMLAFGLIGLIAMVQTLSL